MTTRSERMAPLVVLAVGLCAMGVVVILHRSATAQATDVTQDVTKAPDAQKKTEKSPIHRERPKEVEGKIESQAKAREIRENLDGPTTIEFEPGTPLREALNHISERYGLTILVDQEAFMADNGDAEVENRPIKLPKLVEIKRRTVLRNLLQQVQGDFYVRDDHLMVVPRKEMEAGVVLNQTIDTSIQKRPLVEALKDLSDLTGVTIIVDSLRAAQMGQDKLEVTGDFHNVPLNDAVRVLADMAGMKPVVMRNMIYVTTPRNAAMVLKEQTTGTISTGDDEER